MLVHSPKNNLSLLMKTGLVMARTESILNNTVYVRLLRKHTVLYNVLYISSLETRNLPLNLLQQWQARILCRAFNYLKGQCSNIPVRFRSWVWSGSHFEKNWIRVLQFTLVGCIKCTSTVKGQKTYIFYLAILNHSYLFLERKWGKFLDSDTL